MYKKKHGFFIIESLNTLTILRYVKKHKTDNEIEKHSFFSSSSS